MIKYYTILLSCFIYLCVIPHLMRDLQLYIGYYIDPGSKAGMTKYPVILFFYPVILHQMTQEKIWFNDIVKTMEPRWVMSSMATWAVWILTMIIWGKFNLMFLKYFAGILVFLAIIFFILFVIMFTLRIFKFPNEVKNDLSHPIAANFFAWIFISSAVIVSGIWNVLQPLWWCLNPVLTSKIFYIIALILWTIIPVLVPFMLTISEKVDSKHAIWIWFLPPVGMFVLIFAGNFMALHGIWENFIPYVNIFYMWMAFILYFLVLSMIYSRLKFHSLPAPEVAPSFVIWLAPVGVSIIALNTFNLVLQKNNIFHWDLNFFHSFVALFSSMLAWFGFWWFILTVLILWYYLIKKSIPYTLGWWALVFPIAAFGIWLKFIVLDLSCAWLCPVILFIWGLALSLWFIVFYKTLVWIITKKAFERPKVVK